METTHNTGLESPTFGGRAVQVDDKTIINCRADLNQLEPFKYHWAWQKYKDALANHWVPDEVQMQVDIDQWTTGRLTESEQHLVKRTLGFFVTADSLVANNIVLAIYRHITNPECRQFLLRQAFEEALHTHAYQHIVSSLSLDTAEIFNMYQSVPSVHNKAAWAMDKVSALSRPDFETGTPESDRELLLNLIAFYIIFEGIFFYVGFAQILALGRQNKVPGTVEQIEYILRDESMHTHFGIDVINTIIQENPALWDKSTQQQATQLIKEAVELETAYAQDTMPTPILGLKATILEQYLKHVANTRCAQIGLKTIYPNNEAKNSLPWLDEIVFAEKENNFFEKTVTDYQTGGALNFDFLE